MNHDFQMVF